MPDRLIYDRTAADVARVIVDNSDHVSSSPYPDMQKYLKICSIVSHEKRLVDFYMIRPLLLPIFQLIYFPHGIQQCIIEIAVLYPCRRMGKRNDRHAPVPEIPDAPRCHLPFYLFIWKTGIHKRALRSTADHHIRRIKCQLLFQDFSIVPCSRIHLPAV